MSYSFDGSNDRLTGTFTSTYGDPITLACWFKITAHPGAIDSLLAVGNSSSSNNNSYALRTVTTADRYGAVVVGNSGGTDQANVTKAGIENTWTPFIGVFSGDSQRDCYVSDQTAGNTTANAVADAIQFIRLGESFTAANDYTGLLAEVCVWNKALSAGEIASFLAASAPTGIAAANLIGYWALSQNGVLTNEGIDTGGDLTASGAVFSSDHPTITGGTATRRRRTALLGVG